MGPERDNRRRALNRGRDPRGYTRGRHMITVAMATEVQQHASKFRELSCDKTPHATVTAVSVKTPKRHGTSP